MKLRSVILLVLSIGVFQVVSCQKKVPEDLISPTKMKPLLLDLMLAEAYSMEIYVRDSNRTDGSNKNYDSLSRFYNDILHHHQVSKEQLQSTLDWYLNHPSVLDSTLSALMPELNRIDANLTGEVFHRSVPVSPPVVLDINAQKLDSMMRKNKAERDSIERKKAVEGQ